MSSHKDRAENQKMQLFLATLIFSPKTSLIFQLSLLHMKTFLLTLLSQGTILIHPSFCNFCVIFFFFLSFHCSLFVLHSGCFGVFSLFFFFLTDAHLPYPLFCFKLSWSHQPLLLSIKTFSTSWPNKIYFYSVSLHIML